MTAMRELRHGRPNGKAPPRSKRMARFRFARGNDAQDNARGRFPRKDAGRSCPNEGAKADDADD